MKLLFIFLFICSSSFANTEDVYQDLKEDLLRLRRKVVNPITSFSWFYATDANRPSYRAYLEWKTQMFFSTRNVAGNFGPGLYSALDPLMSENYGRGEMGRVVGITLKKDAYFLDVRAGEKNSIELRKSTVDALSKVCSTHFYNTGADIYVGDVKYMSVFKQHLTKREGCRTLFNRAMRELEISALAYTWMGISGRTGYGKCISGARSSFVITGVLQEAADDPSAVEVDLSKIEITGYKPNTPDVVEAIYDYASGRAKERKAKEEDYLYIHFFTKILKYGPKKKLMLPRFEGLKLSDYPEIAKKIYRSRFECTRADRALYPMIRYD